MFNKKNVSAENGTVTINSQEVTVATYLNTTANGSDYRTDFFHVAVRQGTSFSLQNLCSLLSALIIVGITHTRISISLIIQHSIESVSLGNDAEC